MHAWNGTRRAFLKTLGLGTAALALPGPARGAAGGTATKRPNVVLFFTDDQGTLDVNCYGAKDLHTPGMDALAGRGTRFTQFYVGAPVCSPSRAALLTGRYPQRAELDTNSYGKRGLPGRQVTIAEMLKGAGYRTACFGKWHLGHEPEMSPIAQGFDEFFGHKNGCIDNYSHFFYWSGPNRHDLWRNDAEHHEDGSFFPDLVVREAIRFLEENQDRPFFIYLPFNMPHYPLQGTEKYREMYEDLDAPRKMYAAFLSTLDEKIGRVIDRIDELGLREDTLIIFLSDHGHSVEERTFGGGGWAGPYRGHKFTLWEGGIRVPCIASWPGRIPEGAARGQAAMSMDWMPTIAHYCGVDLEERRIDGENIAPLIASAGAESPHETLHWESGKSWAVREGDWKLVYNGQATVHGGGRIEKVEFFLSNLAEDATETRNLADQYPDTVKRLAGLHEAWAGSVRDQ